MNPQIKFTAFQLIGWPGNRPSFRQDAKQEETYDQIVEALMFELRELSATNCQFIMDIGNAEFRPDGLPVGDSLPRSMPGVMVAFKSDLMPAVDMMLFYHDSFYSWHLNLRAIVLTLTMLRLAGEQKTHVRGAPYLGFSLLPLSDYRGVAVARKEPPKPEYEYRPSGRRAGQWSMDEEEVTFNFGGYRGPSSSSFNRNEYAEMWDLLFGHMGVNPNTHFPGVNNYPRNPRPNFHVNFETPPSPNPRRPEPPKAEPPKAKPTPPKTEPPKAKPQPAKEAPPRIISREMAAMVIRAFAGEGDVPTMLKSPDEMKRISKLAKGRAHPDAPLGSHESFLRLGEALKFLGLK